MVFSQLSRETCSGLKVVDLDRLTSPPGAGISRGGGGVAADLNGSTARASTSRATAKEFPNSEQDQEYTSSTMYHNTDFEFFQDLGLLCCDPVREGPALTTDYPPHHKDKPNTATHTQRSQEVPAPSPGPLSPMDEIFEIFELGSDKFPEQFQDIVAEDGRAFGGWADTHTHTHTYTHTLKSPFIEEDSLDLKLGDVLPREVRLNDALVSEVLAGRARPPALALPPAPAPPPGDVISTPEVVSYVDELEAKSPPFNLSDVSWSETPAAAALDYEPITPKSESHAESEEDAARAASPARRKRRRTSEDSDYNPYMDKSPRKYKKRKNIPLQEMIQVLEESQPITKAKRGRPPKRRDSAVSSVCSGDTTPSTHEHKYREIRDKNNEASKRSRINRKLKELQMEQLSLDLEEKNDKLRVKANILEDMTKRLKDALMTAILKP